MKKPTLILFRNLEPTTWYLLGACLQFVLNTFLPIYYAFFPTAVALIAYAIKVTVTAKPSITLAQCLNRVLKGRYTAEIPHENVSATQDGAGTEVVVFVIGASSNHPEGHNAPGFQEVAGYLQNMWDDAETNRQRWGYLGKSSTLAGTSQENRDTLIILSYWKDVESLNAFSQGPSHRAGWDWWNRFTKQYPHLGIMHEVYVVPKGHTENIYINFQPFGMGQTRYSSKDGQDGLTSPIVKAKGSQWRAMLGRINSK